MRQSFSLSLCPSFSVSVCLSFHLVPVHFWKHLFTFSVPFCHTYVWLLLGPYIFQHFDFTESFFSPSLKFTQKHCEGRTNPSLLEHSHIQLFNTNSGSLRFRLLGGWGKPHAYCAKCVGKGMRGLTVSCMFDVSLGDLSIAEGNVLNSLWFASKWKPGTLNLESCSYKEKELLL